MWVMARVGSRRAAARVLVGGAVGGALVLPRSVAAANPHTEFRFCKKCRGLWFSSVDSDGVCPAGGGHSLLNSHNYEVHYDIPAQPNLESDWRVCSNCRVLFWRSAGICPGGAGHNGTNSPNFVLQYNTQPTNDQQGGWRYCPKCEGLFRPKGRKRGVCPGGGKHEVYRPYKYNLDISVRSPG
jgi:RNA polymerase subunit RPABC4/transcription elongation factor Spt4